MFEFEYPSIDDKIWAEPILKSSERMGCEYCFGNVYSWSRVYDYKIAHYDNFFISRSMNCTNNHIRYSFPVGTGDIKTLIEKMIIDSKAFGCEFRMGSLTEKDIVLLDEIMPDTFQYEPHRDRFDYIYNTDDLVNLAGKKYHSKRNHISAFMKDNKWALEKITAENIGECLEMNTEWNELNRDKNPEDIDGERIAIERCFSKYIELGFVGALLRTGGKVIAFTMGEELNSEIFCTHYEKAFASIRGAYPMINREFAANFLRGYKYINREEDTGDEGLRKAKLSYFPAILLEKFSATLKR